MYCCSGGRKSGRKVGRVEYQSLTNLPQNRAANTRIDFRYLSEDDTIAAGVMDMAACVDAMEDTFALYAAGDYRMAGPNNDSHGPA